MAKVERKCKGCGKRRIVVFRSECSRIECWDCTIQRALAAEQQLILLRTSVRAGAPCIIGEDNIVNVQYDKDVTLPLLDELLSHRTDC